VGELATQEQERRGRAFMSVYLLLAAAATAAFALLAVFARDEDVIRYFDGPVAGVIQGVRWPLAAWLLTHMSDLGFLPYDVMCVVLIFVILFALRLRLEAVVIVLSTLVAGELGMLTKDLVQRARPSSSFVHLATHLADYSFPSGHVIFATVLFGTTFWVVWIAWRTSPVRNAVLAVLAALVLLMGPSRVYLGAHWPTDVIGAYCLSALWVAGTVELILALKPRLGASWNARQFRRRLKPLL
jgi:membrane-associated phospholipid phosphatase